MITRVMLSSRARPVWFWLTATLLQDGTVLVAGTDYVATGGERSADELRSNVPTSRPCQSMMGTAGRVRAVRAVVSSFVEREHSKAGPAYGTVSTREQNSVVRPGWAPWW